LFLGRRGVRLEMAGGVLSLVRVGPLRGERVVVSAPVTQFHSPAPSRSGRGLHLWHGARVFRLVGRAESSDDGGGTDASSSSADDPISAFFAVLALPLYVFTALAEYTDKVAGERRHVAMTLRWLSPVVGPPPPGVTFHPPLPGGWPTTARWTVRLTVLGALAAGVMTLL
jgi:hypothetical protein